MSDRTKIAAGSKQIVFVPLGRLKKSPKNVRKAPYSQWSRIIDDRVLTDGRARIGAVAWTLDRTKKNY
jgi:hypothetical protein